MMRGDTGVGLLAVILKQAGVTRAKREGAERGAYRRPVNLAKACADTSAIAPTTATDGEALATVSVPARVPLSGAAALPGLRFSRLERPAGHARIHLHEGRPLP
jgi:hypothetical protein